MKESDTGPTIETMLREQAWLRRLAASLVVDAAQADDLAQQTLLAALERPPQRDDHPRAWLATVVRNLALKLSASERHRVQREHFSATSERLLSTDEVVARAALQHDVCAAVLALDEPYRSTLLLRFFDDLPPRAIAKKTGVPIETVRTRLKRGVECVRAELVGRRGSGDAHGEAARRPVLGLLALLDPWTRRIVKHAIVAKSAAGTAIVGVGGSTALSVMGVLWMSTKVKFAVAALVVVAGALAIVTMRSPAASAPSSGHPTSRDVVQAEPGTGDGHDSSTPAEATRSAEPIAPHDEPASAAAPPRGARCSIEGVVRTARGDPAAGALVLMTVVDHGVSCIGSLESLSQSAFLFLGVRPDRVARVARDPRFNGLRHTTSAEDGTFRFDDLDPAPNVDVAAVHAVEGMAVVNGLALDTQHMRRSVAIKLPDSVVLFGSVRDREGRPIANANVGPSAMVKNGEAESCFGLPILGADVDGNYRTCAFPRWLFSLECEAPGYVQQCRDPLAIREGEHEHREDFTLQRATTLRGPIVQLDGSRARLHDVEGHLAVVATAFDPTTWKDHDGPQSSIRQGGLDEHDDCYYEVVCRGGNEKFVSLWSGNVLLGWAPITPAGSDASTDASAEPSLGPELRVDLSRIPRPEQTASLTLEVVDAADGNVVPAFTVSVLRSMRDDPESFAAPLTAKSEARDGRIEIPQLKLGTYDVEVRAAGFAARLAVAHVTADPNAPPQRIELVPATASLHGTVLDEQSRPLADATISVLALDGRAALPFPDYRAVTNADGRFSFEQFPDGDYLVVAEKSELAPAVAHASGGDDDVLLTLRPGVVVKLVPEQQEERDGSDFHDGYQFTIRDEQGVPVIDTLRHGVRSVNHGNPTFHLLPGVYTVELFALNCDVHAVQFVAAPNLSVSVRLVPTSTAAVGR